MKTKKNLRLLLFSTMPVCLLAPNTLAGTYVPQNPPTPQAATVAPTTAFVFMADPPDFQENHAMPASDTRTYIWLWAPDNDDPVADPAPAKYVEHSYALSNGPIISSYVGPADTGGEANFGAVIRDQFGTQVGSDSKNYSVQALWSYSTPTPASTNFPGGNQVYTSLTTISPVGGIIQSNVTAETGAFYAFAYAAGPTATGSTTVKGSIITTGVSLTP